MKKIKQVLAVMTIVMLYMITFLAQPTKVYSDGLTSTPKAISACQEILNHAIDMLRNTCNGIARNQACYGNMDVHVQLSDPTAGIFSSPGDKLPIRVIKLLTTSSLDVSRQTWGLSLMKIQADLPDTLPGQNVLFVIYGNTSVTNSTSDMRAFYISSGLNNPTCQDVPSDGVVIHSPDHIHVSFVINGVQISIASTIVIHASQNREMTIQLVEGKATISTVKGTVQLQPGQRSSVQLGGLTGLEPISVPSQPITMPLDPAMVTLITLPQTIDDPTTMTNFNLTGCITRMDGQIVTIYGYAVDISSNNKNTDAVHIGDCIHVDGNLKLDNKGKVVLVAGIISKAQPDEITSTTANSNSIRGSTNTSQGTVSPKNTSSDAGQNNDDNSSSIGGKNPGDPEPDHGKDHKDKSGKKPRK